MTTTLWAKDDSAIDEAIQRFVAADDVIVDRALFPYDLRATQAHVRGLGRIEVLDDADVMALTSCLDELRRAFEDGSFILDARFEDGHSAIEHFVTERLGDVGKRLHTGRSRNDQVQVALRLYMRDRLAALGLAATAVARACLDCAEAKSEVPMPGYTHLQRAVPSSVGLWMAGFTEAFLDDAELATMTSQWLDASPLGTGAGFGVNLPLDRDGVAQELGFSRLQLNPQYVQNARGKFELAVLGALGQALLDVRRLAWDLSLYTTAEYGFVSLPMAYTTGSSLMPNKRNPDVVELLRAAYGRCFGAQAEIASVLSLPSGYQRDLQSSKAAFVGAMDHGLSALALVPRLLRGMTLDEARMRAAITKEMYATDRALERTRDGVPFRDAYRDVAKHLDEGDERTPEQSLRARVSPGGCGALGLDVLRDRLEARRGGA